MIFTVEFVESIINNQRCDKLFLPGIRCGYPAFHLFMDQLLQDDFLRRIPDIIHRPHPGHLIIGFEFLGDALCCGHLLGQQFHLGISSGINLI